MPDRRQNRKTNKPRKQTATGKIKVSDLPARDNPRGGQSQLFRYQLAVLVENDRGR